MTKVERYTREAENIAMDNSHGYSIENRYGPDYDCSSLVISVVDNAGIPVKNHGATFTGDMLYAFLACGFANVVSMCNLATGSGMKRGDILLNYSNHAAIYQGNGKVVHARGNEGHPEPGDQSGGEILANQNYWNFPWDAVLRYMRDEEYEGADEPAKTTGVLADDIVIPRPDAPWHAATNYPDYPYIMRYNDMGTEVQEMQAKLNAIGYDCGKTDGIYGKMTLAAVTKFQEDKNLLVDGEAGPETLGKLLECYYAMTGNTEAFYNGNTIVIGKTDDDANTVTAIGGYKLGEIVDYKGGNFYISPNMNLGKEGRPGKAKITSMNEKGKHQIHLVAVRDGGSNVYGWVNVDNIAKA